MKWVTASGILHSEQMQQRYQQINVGRMAALCYPDAPLDRLTLIAKLLAWLCLDDDVHDQAAEGHDQHCLEKTFSTYYDVLSGSIDGKDHGVVASALGDLRSELAQTMPRAWMARFCASMKDFWLRGMFYETQLRAANHIPLIDEYMRMRVYTIGVLPCINLIEFAGGFTLPNTVVAERHMQELSWLTARIISYVNDLFSYEKERKIEDPYNHLCVLTHHDKLDINLAVDRVIRTHDAELSAFNACANALPDFGPQLSIPVAAYVEGHRAWMRGVFDWHGVSQRYDASNY